MTWCHFEPCSYHSTVVLARVAWRWMPWVSFPLFLLSIYLLCLGPERRRRLMSKLPSLLGFSVHQKTTIFWKRLAYATYHLGGT